MILVVAAGLALLAAGALGVPWAASAASILGAALVAWVLISAILRA